jgi:predicted AAA+ superfamily ATPase
MLKREKYLKKIRPFYDDDLIKVLVGIRRAGKSVLLDQIAEEMLEKTDKEHIIKLDFEILEYSELREKNKLNEYIESKKKKKNRYYILIDEIQEVHEYELAINSLRAKHKASIFITGSNAHLLSGELATYLSGRYLQFYIAPFSFSEVCEFKEGDRYEIFSNYSVYGGLPQRFDYGDDTLKIKKYLHDVYNSIVLRDIIHRSKISNEELLNKIIMYLVENTGCIFSANKIINFIHSQRWEISPNTIYNYLALVMKSLLFNKVERYDIRGKQVLETLEKYYIADLGLLQVRGGVGAFNYGARFETVIYNELLSRDYQVFIGKNKEKEVDFIVIKDNVKKYIQASYKLDSDSVIEREFGVFENIKDNFEKIVVSMDKIDFSRNGIRHVNGIEFLLGEFI